MDGRSVDELAMAPPEELSAYGVTADNADLLRPGPSFAAQCALRARQARAERLLRAAGTMSPTEFTEALAEALRMLGHDSAG